MKNKNNKESAKAKKEEEVSTGKETSPGNPGNESAMEKKETVPEKKEEEPTLGKEVQSSPASPAAEPPGEEAEVLKPMREPFPYLGQDSTAVVDYELIRSDFLRRLEEEKDPVGEWMQRTKGAKVDTSKAIKDGIELAKEMTADYNYLVNSTGGELAEKAIHLGKLLNRLKPLVRSSGMNWVVWGEKNLDFISKRGRERCMLLASRPDCHKFAFLGQERLELLIAATRGSDEPDPIKTLLAKYEIVYDPKAETNLDKFKLLVDSAVNSENLSKNGTGVPFEKVKNLTALAIEFDKSMLKRLKDIQESGGNVETYLNKRSMTMGAEVEETAEDKRLADVNSLSNRLIKTLDYVSKDEDELEKLDMKTLDLLWEKLRKIRELKNPAGEPEKEDK